MYRVDRDALTPQSHKDLLRRNAVFELSSKPKFHDWPKRVTRSPDRFWLQGGCWLSGMVPPPRPW